EATGREPGFLIGGLPENFAAPVRLGRGECFVIEADEYDTAFFDKRAKFVHYRPRVLVLANLEYDHADIYPDLAAIERQFHHLVRTVPGSGRIIVNGGAAALARVLKMGCWTPVDYFGEGPQASLAGQSIAPDRFELWVDGKPKTTVRWNLRGAHNMENALAALAAVRALGVPLDEALAVLPGFRGVRRRLTLLAETNDICLYDDFAHHPTAISRTLAGLAAPGRRLVVAFEPRSRSLRAGVNAEGLAVAFAQADRVFVFRRADLAWDPATVLKSLGAVLTVHSDIEALAAQLLAEARPGDDIVLMSNGGFGGLPARLQAALGNGGKISSKF
ncbi:MAG TPA: Mur ligase family protein, partial [Gammaproteobacteria bacterium]|nr:Mur ligase family protein [Gammaproteobacteria bacterium]